MRIGLYNRWLSILGGGERYMLELALALAGAGCQVELLAHEAVADAQVRQRLGLDLSAFTLRLVDDDVAGAAVAEASSAYDLFINVSHGDLLPARGRRNWLVVFFPELEVADGDLAAAEPYLWRGGYAEERDAHGRPFRWLAPEGALWLPPSVSGAVSLRIERPLGGPVALQVAGGMKMTLDVAAGRPAQGTLPLPANPAQDGTLIFWRTPRLSLADPRPLGMRLLGMRLGRPHFFVPLRGRELLPAERPAPALALASYDRLLAISNFTAGWIVRRWRRNSELLSPPVPQYTADTKQRLILSVGRFFRGLHAKRHDVLIEAFRLLLQRERGWELHLAGGLDETNRDHQMYLEELRQAARDLPVHFHVNIPGEELRRLYGSACFYWHAAGYGSDSERDPQAQEHFGITTVEAMSAGCVPLVYGSGGPAEVIEDGVYGRLWWEPAQLAQLTFELINAPERRAQLAAAAGERAAQFSSAAFAERAARLLDAEREALG